MHGIYVKGNSSKRYKRGIRTYRGLDRASERERWMYKECRGREIKGEREREREREREKEDYRFVAISRLGKIAGIKEKES